MLELKIQIKSIDYSTIVDKLLPRLLEVLAQKENTGPMQLLLGKFNGLSISAFKAAIAVLPQEVIEELVVCFSEYYKEDIIKNINQMAVDNQLKIEVGDFNLGNADIN